MLEHQGALQAVAPATDDGERGGEADNLEILA
jgi:hypothetical protein